MLCIWPVHEVDITLGSHCLRRSIDDEVDHMVKHEDVEETYLMIGERFRLELWYFTAQFWTTLA